MTTRGVGDPLEETWRAFVDLEALQALLDSTLEYASDSLHEYRDEESGGWLHLLRVVQPRPPGSFSAASTATCLSFVRAAHRADLTPEQAQALKQKILKSHWSSAGLDRDNPFTVAFLLEAINDLLDLGATLDRNDAEAVENKLDVLRGAFEHEEPENDGGISIQGYPPTAFLTFKGVRTLRAWQARSKGRQLAAPGDIFPTILKQKILRWAWSDLHAESVRVASGAHDADVFELAYAVLTITTSTELDEMTPPQRDVIAYALDQFFYAQRSNGTWPRSRPLFHYPRIGAAYCYDYELLVALLSDRQLRAILRRHLSELRLATDALQQSRFPLGRGYGWASGHLRQVPSAESWSTASVLHYCYELRRLVADELSEVAGRYIGQPVGEVSSARGPEIDTAKFLDSEVELPGDGDPVSLVRILEQHLLEPLHEHRHLVEHGRRLPGSISISAILYGPPGTSKTQLADIIGQALGWPILKIDPSHLLRQGQDRIHTETYRLFNMLQLTERVVVLLDEFDEFVRGREAPGEVVSRMLTTSMLPKLTALSSQRRLVVLLATNHLEMLDAAITRPGRFDLIVPVMPPALDAKFAKWPNVRENYLRLRISGESTANARVRETLADLTFSEFEAVAPRLAAAESVADFRTVVRAAEDGCTLRRRESDEKTWAERINDQKAQIRIPDLPG